MAFLYREAYFIKAEMGPLVVTIESDKKPPIFEKGFVVYKFGIDIATVHCRPSKPVNPLITSNVMDAGERRHEWESRFFVDCNRYVYMG